MKFIILLFIPLLGFSQQNKITIEYDFYDNYRYQETIAILNCDNETAIFKTFLERLNTDEKSGSNSSGEITIGGDRIDLYRVTNKKNNTLISYDIRKDDIYEITEEVPKMDWKIGYTETKKIANYNCSKATVSFRGRNYTAWYTIQLPFSFGPWKFNGLPGLILEIYDVTNTFKWRASKIKYPTNTILKVPYKKVKRVTLKKLIAIEDQNMKVLRARIMSLLPKQGIVTTPENDRNDIELVYEWEK
ncbi:GLPGLI family protein [Tenacibaculum finnmarkense]|uniref:GLPGLI family protein n=1 Tax=Tenacibaculum finnmarkense TaxID=2781243 RepID=UPI00187B8017|nr:GLPGLI family protein [Tenacibaculum finnmarkense]MBE7660538.1 GLPGLI family protein [Tenacibaculum finnmarkense genomovar finnmarkense]MCG8252227.1 GLPGLI family protein [Tenacibaculum finnmarkense genomovar finnmarkense]MCG8815706.1 GLPGLI family protein [Tenacibaculum finnmarkense]MCG8821029.1 GLPGLI family protein [Tenacibaculum finnmarkense]